MPRPPIHRFDVPLAASLALLACADCTSARDGGDADAGARPDGGTEDAGPTGSVTALWQLPRGESAETFALPWPSDVYRTPAGGLDFSILPNPGRNPTITEYLGLMSEFLTGYATNGAVYFRFSDDLAQGTLPSPSASVTAESSIWIVDVTPGSPTYGARIPLRTRFQSAPTRYWPAHTLAVLPVHGFVLRPETTYAVVVTTAVQGSNDAAVAPDADLTAVLASNDVDAAQTAARALHAPTIEALESFGLDRSRIASLAVFTTMDPVDDMFRASEWARTSPPPPVIEAIEFAEAGNNYDLFTGAYGPVPILQHGEAPYTNLGSGGFSFSENGEPEPDHFVSVRFALSLPRGDPPPGGWPITLYAHGTGGDYQSFVEDRTAAAMAARGMATMGIDQVLHGEREGAGGGGGTQFFNYANPLAGRDNNRQAAIDVVVQARLVRDLVVPAAVTPDGVDVPIDGERILFFGHSQGSLNGPLFLATDPSARAAVLSGAAAIVSIALVEKEEPVDLPALVELLLGIDIVTEEWDVFHPVATLVQTWIEPAEPANYAPYVYREPRVGGPRSVVQTEGLLDLHSTPNGIEALAVAIGLPIIHPAARFVEGLELRGFATERGPVTGNLVTDGGTVTGGLLQYSFSDHFVVFSDDDARERTADFLRSVAEGGVGTIDSP